MEWPQLYVLALAIAVTVLLATEKVSLGLIGTGLMVAVAVPGVLPIGDAIAGFSNKAVVMVAALTIVGEGFLRTGAASLLANRILTSTGGRETTVVFLIMAMAAMLSAFVNNILIVVTFMPVITTICRSTGIYPSRLLIPLSYASILGGMCTLVGTSTNVLVSGVLEKSTLPGHDGPLPPIGMFEMSPAGLLMAGAGLLYIGLIGRHFLPRIPSLAGQVGAEALREYVTEITVGKKSPLLDQSVRELGMTSKETNSMVASMLVRGELVIRPPFGEVKVQEGDTLVISGDVSDLASLHHDPAHTAESDGDRYRPSQMSFFELALTPTSGMAGRRIRDLQLKKHFGAVVIGLMRAGHHIQSRFADLRIGTGDVLLAFGDERSRDNLRGSADFHLIEGVGDVIYREEKAPVAMAIILGVVAGFVLLGSWLDPCTVALTGSLAMVLSGCLSSRQAHRAVPWSTLTLIAGMIGLSAAFHATGTDRIIGDLLNSSLGSLGDPWLLAGVFVSTIVLTELLSNNAVAVLMTPIALATADSSGIDYRALIMAVAFGASVSFANPVGYKTNLLVLGPGGYRFVDFLRVGLVLDLLLAGLGIVVLPWFFPLD